MTFGPVQESPFFSLSEAALRLDVEEAAVREWLSTFNWERRFDSQGNLYLSLKDIEFLRVVKSLKDVDRSCDSIVRIIAGDETLEVETTLAGHEVSDASAWPEVETPEPACSVTSNLDQIETLKAELKELHAKPAKKPFWKFW